MTITTDENELAKSLVYWVSRRGTANYWATLINGCSKQYQNSEGTMSVQLTDKWRYLLTCHMPFFEACTPHVRLLVLVHEAAHIALNHIPRLFRLLANCTDPIVRTAIMSTFNFAADFAANDAIVRLEPHFKDCHLPVKPETFEEVATATLKQGTIDKWPFLMPEDWGLPTGKSMEEYFVLLLEDLPKFKQMMQQMMDSLQSQLKELADSEGDIVTSPFRGGGRGLPNRMPGLPDNLIQQAINDPSMFEIMQKIFDKLTGNAHKQWNEKAEKMTPGEAISAGNKMKNHAKSLARSANERMAKGRGYLPGHLQKIIDALLEPEQLPWDIYLKDIIQGAISARVQEEMASPNLSLINEDYLEPWPGQILEFGFNITWMTDTSGSMHDDEYARACACLNSLLASNKSIYVTYVECDAQIQKEMKVNNISPPEKKNASELITRRGYGGTIYTPFFKRVAGVDEPRDWEEGAPRLDEAHPRPDLIVIYTDGGVGLMGECFPKYQPACPIIWLLAPNCHPVPGMDNVAPNRLVEMFKMREED